MGKKKGKGRVQYAAMPWRSGAGGAVEVLLVTTRETRRWVIPKGWPVEGLTPPGSAAREAWEEAGVAGTVAETPVGAFSYDKRLKSGRKVRLRVQVFPLQVATVHEDWPEKAERERRWTSLTEAAGLVEEPELKTLLADFRP